MVSKSWHINIHHLGTINSSLSYFTDTLHSYVATCYLSIRTFIKMNMK